MVDYELKYQEVKKYNDILLRKIKDLEAGKPPVRKNLLGLVPGNLYLIITNGRRIVGKLEFEAKSFVCYSKREGIKYYANKLNIELIKELTENDQKNFYKSNFQEFEKMV